MTDEKLCNSCKERFAPIDQQSCWSCVNGDCYRPDKPTKTKKRMTNFERIKAMTVEEMAEFFGEVECYECPFAGIVCETFSDDCAKHFIKWLESECGT